MTKKAASVRDLDQAEVRGVMNTGYTDVKDGGDDDNDCPPGGWFMVDNRQFAEHQPDFMEEIKNAPWYYGKISHEKAEAILNDSVTPGTYIVRSRKKTEFYISVRAREGWPKVRHIEVDRYKDNFVAGLGTNEDAIGFATFGKLIAYLRSTPTYFEGCDEGVLLTDYVDRLGMTIL